MVLNLATTGKAGFPIWMESHSGNASDKKILHEAAERMKTLCQSIKDAPTFMTVGDSAIYEACLKQTDSKMLWLTRVPETHKPVKELLRQLDSAYNWVELNEDYKISATETIYKDVPQRWLVVYSAQAHQKECKTLDKKIEKIENEYKKELWHVGNTIFKCEEDAENSLKAFQKKGTYHTFSGAVEPVLKYKGKGRPSKDSTPATIAYKIVGTIEKNETTISLEKNTKGRFLLATTQMDKTILPDEEMLSEYKGQSRTESGFKFIKDNTFEVSSIFLKKPSRITSLMMVMTLCLMIYGIAEYDLRCALKAAKDTIPSQTKKPTEKPTMKWVYRMFHGVHLVRLTLQEVTQEIVINLKAVHKKIISFFGQRAMGIYGIT
jgi:transposase